jgi:hypothetical protein
LIFLNRLPSTVRAGLRSVVLRTSKIDSTQRIYGFGEAANGRRRVLTRKHLDNLLGRAEEFHGSAARIGAVTVLLGSVQVAVLAEVNH